MIYMIHVCLLFCVRLLVCSDTWPRVNAIRHGLDWNDVLNAPTDIVEQRQKVATFYERSSCIVA